VVQGGVFYSFYCYFQKIPLANPGASGNTERKKREQDGKNGKGLPGGK
jgi:hypothetical protein